MSVKVEHVHVHRTRDGKSIVLLLPSTGTVVALMAERTSSNKSVTRGIGTKSGGIERDQKQRVVSF